MTDDVDESWQQHPAVLAAVDLTRRAGALGVEIGYEPTEPPRWYFEARYTATTFTVRGCRTPDQAAVRLAKKLLDGGMCRCGRTGTTDALEGRRSDRCLWQLIGAKWEPACGATPAPALGMRGNIADMKAALVRHLDQKE